MTEGAERGALWMAMIAAYLCTVLLGVKHGIWIPLWLTVGGNVLAVVWSRGVHRWLIARRRRRELASWRRFQAGRCGVAPDRSVGGPL